MVDGYVYVTCRTVNYAIRIDLIIAGIESEEVGLGKGGVPVILMLIERPACLTVIDTIIIVFNCHSMGTMATIPAAN